MRLVSCPVGTRFAVLEKPVFTPQRIIKDDAGAAKFEPRVYASQFLDDRLGLKADFDESRHFAVW